MRLGVRIGIDVGSVRVGIARSDASGTLAVPVETLKRDSRLLDAVAHTVTEYEAIEVLVGFPLSMSGKPGRRPQSRPSLLTSLRQESLRSQ